MIKINILFCGDKNIEKGIYLSCLSLIKHTERNLNIFILTAEIKEGNMEYKALSSTFAKKLEKIVKAKNQKSTVKLINVSSFFLNYLPTANLNTRFTPLCMLRLFSDVVDEIPDKILYLDCDVLCLNDFSEFYDTDITFFDIMGVPDRYGKWFFSKPFYKHNYLNSGVLLMNMKNIRKNRLFLRCREMCKNKKMFMPDQTALNKTSVKKIAPSKYNNQGKIKNDTVFKHFTTFFKFWPFFHPVTIKPWEPEKVNKILKIYEFDDLFYELKKGE